MATDQWADYLEAACEHLRQSRRCRRGGLRRPAGPAASTAPLPDELRGRVQLLAAGYDQLALEVSTRMAQMQRYRRTHVPPAPPASQFVDQRV